MSSCAKYDEKLVAHLYNYLHENKKFLRFSSNGDVGIIILTKPLDATDGIKPTPICLPIHKALSQSIMVRDGHVIKGVAQTTIAGSGARLDEIKGRIERNSSCTTNEAMKPDSTTRTAFLQCKKYQIIQSNKRKNSFCTKLNEILYVGKSGVTDKTLHTTKAFPAKATSGMIKFEYRGAGPLGLSRHVTAQLQNIKNDLDKCEKIWPKALDAIRQNKKLNTLFDVEQFTETIDRIEVVSFQCPPRATKIHHTCYNLQKVGKYGICETYRDEPHNWGFCSRSCDYEYQRSPMFPERYEEVTLQLWEVPPKRSLLASGIIFAL